MLKKIIITGFVCALTSNFAFALPNPASVFCAQHGGQTVMEHGTGRGLCVFTSTAGVKTFCEEWAYFRGQCQPGQNVYPATTR